MKIIIPAHIAYDAMRFVSKEETRYYLQGFLIHREADGSGSIVSTDGHRLGMFRVSAVNFTAPEDAQDVIVRLGKSLMKACAAAKKVFDKKGDITPLTIDTDPAEKSAFIVGVDGECITEKFVIIDGTFPDYGRVIPNPGKLSPGSATSFNAEYLVDFQKVGGLCSIFSDHEDVGAPMLVLSGNRADFIGVLMPCRASYDTAKHPFTLYPQKMEAAA